MKSRSSRGDRGAITTEYAFMLLVIALAVAFTMQTAGTGIAALYQQAVAAL